MLHLMDRIEKQVLLSADLDRVWRALTDAEEFGRWFGVKFEGQFSPGAVMKGVLVPTEADAEVAKEQESYAGMAFEIVVDHIEPKRLFSFRWHPFAVDEAKDYSQEPSTLITFFLEETEGGVMLSLSETGFDQIPLERRKDAFEANDEGWTLQASMLAKYVEG